MNINDRVNKGQPIVCFDKEMIEEKGYNMITMMIVVNDERISKLEKGDQLDKLLIKVQCLTWRCFFYETNCAIY